MDGSGLIVWIVIALYFIIANIIDYFKEKKHISDSIKRIPELEKEVEELKNYNNKLLNTKSQISENVINFRKDMENERNRKIYFANQRKRRFRRY